MRRREFLKLLGLSAGSASLTGCDEWLAPERLVELALRGPGIESFRQTVCGLCESGCGLTVRLVDGLPVGLKGNPHHPLNRGGLCPVGQAGLEVLYAPHRLERPQRRQNGGFQDTTWDDALAEIAARLGQLHGAGDGLRVGLLSGVQGIFDDLAAAFLRAFDSPNLGRFRVPAVLPYTLTQGLREVPSVDLDGADRVISFGLDLYEDGPAPLYATSALVGSRSFEDRAELLYVGTRLSPTAAQADERLLIEPGTHGAMALGIAHILVREGRYDRDFVAEHTFGFEDWKDDDGNPRLGFRRLLLEQYYPDRVAQICGCDAARIFTVARRLASGSTPVALVGGDATAGSNATWTGIAVQALNALLGAFDRSGGITLTTPIPLTPAPPLPASPSIFAAPAGGTALGRDPVAALADAVLDGSQALDVLFVVGANPVHGSPAGERFRQALEKIPLVVACTPFRDETAAAADLILPAHTFLEGWQAATNPEGVPYSILGLGEPVVEPLFDTRHPGDLLLDLARRVGGTVASALPWETYDGYLQHRLEGLVTSGQGSVISGSFEEAWIHYLEERGWRFLEQNDPGEFWHDLRQQSAWWNPVRLQGHWERLLATPSGRFEFFSHALEAHLKSLGNGDGLSGGAARLGLEVSGDEACLPHFEPPRVLGEGDLTLIPFRPITARGEQGIASPMLLEMFGFAVLDGWRTWIELTPETAHQMHLHDGDEVAVEASGKSLEAVVRVRPGSAPGAVFMPVGLGHREGVGAAAGIGANPLELLAEAADPLSGAPSLTSTRVSLRLLRHRPHGQPAPTHGGHG